MGTSERRRRTTLVALRLLPGEHHALLAAATARGVTLSEYVRSSALREAAEAATMRAGAR